MNLKILCSMGLAGLLVAASAHAQPETKAKEAVKAGRAKMGEAKVPGSARGKTVPAERKLKPTMNDGSTLPSGMRPEKRGKADVAEKSDEAKSDRRGKGKGRDKRAKGSKGAMKKAEKADDHPEPMEATTKPEAAAEGRKARREKQREEAKARMKGVASEDGAVGPEVAAQQRRHAKQVARLQRIQEVAEEEGDEKTAARAKALEAKAHARHEAWLAKKAAAKEKK